VRALSAVVYDQLRVLYRTLLVFATVGTVILGIGFVQFVYFERPGEETGVKARIVGVYRYDPGSGKTIAPDHSEFARSDAFAAVVDWSSVPSNLVVDARWYDTFGSMRGSVGPARAGDLVSDGTIPVEVPEGFRYVLPGRYTFVVERFEGGVAVEVLARRFVLVDRT
jgi:hypothetical protein